MPVRPWERRAGEEAELDIVLIPGLWLDGASWGRVVPVLEGAGDRAYPITLPGLESSEADRSKVSLGDHVGAVVAAIDACSQRRVGCCWWAIRPGQA